MGFEASSAAAYLRFMGGFSVPLAVQFADLAAVSGGQRALDVGCGPGTLTAELARRLGPAAVCAVDPSPPLQAAARERLPEVDVRLAAAERLPFPDGSFDVVLAQLVVHFMDDPVAGLREMGRVARPGGTVAACVWDHAGERGPVGVFWRAARQLDAAAPDESDLAGAREGHLASLFGQAGLSQPATGTLTVTASFPSFEQWWEPYTRRVGPAGAYLASLTGEQRAAVREQCRAMLPAGPVEVTASAWATTARA